MRDLEGGSGLVRFIIKSKKKEVKVMVESDQYKTILNTYRGPLVEVRDSL